MEATATIKLVAQGQADVGFPSPGVFSLGLEQGIPLISVWDMGAYDVFSFAFRKGEKVAKIADLAGKTILLGSAGWQSIVDPMLAQAGVDPKSVHYAEAGNLWGQALKQGQGDAALSWEGLRAQWTGQGLDFDYILPTEFSKFPANSFVIRRKDFEDPAKDELYEAYLRAWAMGLEFGHRNPRAATHIVLQQFPALASSLTPEVATELMMQLANVFRGDWARPARLGLARPGSVAPVLRHDLPDRPDHQADRAGGRAQQQICRAGQPVRRRPGRNRCADLRAAAGIPGGRRRRDPERGSERQPPLRALPASAGTRSRAARTRNRGAQPRDAEPAAERAARGKPAGSRRDAEPGTRSRRPRAPRDAEPGTPSNSAGPRRRPRLRVSRAGAADGAARMGGGPRPALRCPTSMARRGRPPDRRQRAERSQRAAHLASTSDRHRRCAQDRIAARRAARIELPAAQDLDLLGPAQVGRPDHGFGAGEHRARHQPGPLQLEPIKLAHRPPLLARHLPVASTNVAATPEVPNGDDIFKK